jgi:ribonuclease J
VGWTPSERTVAAALRRIIADAPGRVIVTSFASHIHRLQEVVDGAVEAGRKVAVVGRSMTKNLNIARNLGYAVVPEGTLIRPAEIADLRPEDLVLLCTGSQGEPLSALTRIAFDAHPLVSIEPGDTVILSSNPVPGNELAVGDTVNQLHRKGARVLTQAQAPVHVSGHGSADELLTVLALVRPAAVIPVHGEMRHMVAHRELAIRSGVAADRVFVGENGCVYELSDGVVHQLPSIKIGQILVDGLSLGEPGESVMRDRRQLSDDGVLIVVCQVSEGGPTDEPVVIARGFGEDGSGVDDLFVALRAAVVEALAAAEPHEHSLRQERVHDVVAELGHSRTRKRPLVLPVIVES